MLVRPLLAGLALAALAPASEADPFRRHARPAYPSPYPPAYQPAYPPPVAVAAGEVGTAPAPAETVPVTYTANYAPAATPDAAVSTAPGGGLDGDGLDEVNAKRAMRGLRPFVRDEGLTQAARACAQYRAAYGMFGHTSNDFAFVPAGSMAGSAGCAAYPAGFGWMSCCTYDNYTYGGAAWVTGSDGRRYMHLFVR